MPDFFFLINNVFLNERYSIKMLILVTLILNRVVSIQFINIISGSVDQHHLTAHFFDIEQFFC